MDFLQNKWYGFSFETKEKQLFIFSLGLQSIAYDIFSDWHLS